MGSLSLSHPGNSFSVTLQSLSDPKNLELSRTYDCQSKGFPTGQMCRKQGEPETTDNVKSVRSINSAVSVVLHDSLLFPHKLGQNWVIQLNYPGDQSLVRTYTRSAFSPVTSHVRCSRWYLRTWRATWTFFSEICNQRRISTQKTED